MHKKFLRIFICFTGLTSTINSPSQATREYDMFLDLARLEGRRDSVEWRRVGFKRNTPPRFEEERAATKGELDAKQNSVSGGSAGWTVRRLINDREFQRVCENGFCKDGAVDFSPDGFSERNEGGWITVTRHTVRKEGGGFVYRRFRMGVLDMGVAKQDRAKNEWVWTSDVVPMSIYSSMHNPSGHYSAGSPEEFRRQLASYNADLARVPGWASPLGFPIAHAWDRAVNEEKLRLHDACMAAQASLESYRDLKRRAPRPGSPLMTDADREYARYEAR
jgi:hypothetical protein